MNLAEPAVSSLPTGYADVADEQLVLRFQTNGCAQAIDELLRRHLRRVRSMLFPMVLDHALADDLTQETFLRAWRGLKSFRSEAKFLTWLTRIAWNVVQDNVARRERTASEFAEHEPAARVIDQPQASLLQHELDDRITAALAGLSPKLRAAIVLTGLQQLSPDEAAELEGCTVSTMYWRIHEARRLLEERLADYLTM